jgi:cytochrome c oxidase assembly protein subunit 15
MNLEALRPVRAWLLTVYGLILVIVVIGGITRLTGSGLSMVEWQPLIGALPPLNEADWQAVFAKYQQTPQYRLVNDWMTLGDFKRIFFWEYFHRLFGRVIGVVFLVPWLWFLVSGRLRGRWAWRTGVAFVLGGLQGALGWFMVQSGLVDVPAVSHYRLAAHLLLAFVVGQYVLWLALETRPKRVSTAGPGLRRFGRVLVALVCLQVVYGAFMAGTRAGWMYSTFPTMHGEWVPSNLFAFDPLWRNFLDNPTTIHFLHRLLGYIVTAAALAFWFVARRRAPGARAVALLPWIVLAQLGLGVATVLLNVPIALAVAHQGVAFLLLSASVAGVYALRPQPVSDAAADLPPLELVSNRR